MNIFQDKFTSSYWWIYKDLIPIWILSFTFLFLNNQLNSCFSFEHYSIELFILILALVYSVFIVLFHVIKAYRTRKLLHQMVLIAAIAITLIITSRYRSFYKDFVKNGSILIADINSGNNDLGKLYLLNKTEFYVEFGEHNTQCSFTSQYKIHSDTLALGGNVYEKSNQRIADYYIVKSDKMTPILMDNFKKQTKEMNVLKNQYKVN